MQTGQLACDAKFLNSQRDERWTIHGTDAEASWVLAGAYGVGLGDQQPEEPGKPWHGITIDVSWCIMMYLILSPNDMHIGSSTVGIFQHLVI